MDFYSFYTGFCFDAYKFLGAHYSPVNTVFRTFAPNAAGINLLYNGREIPMQRICDGNFYETTVEKANVSETYEYRIYHADGGYTDHCDPYGFQSEMPPQHKSVICDLGKYSFGDDKWLENRSVCADTPLNIYEMHLGSWRRKADGGLYSYSEIAEPLISYLKEAGYNYVEFMPICEYPCDESWGYQNTGFFAPTSRYGNPDDLMRLIDNLHQNNIGVILDFVPVHFAVDEFALARYDGGALYEYPHNAVGVSEWGSYNFMHSRGEARSFLQSSANYWLSEFHFDGLRMDAVSRIIYWQGDKNRGVNGNAVDFIKVMNKGLKERNKNCILIAEDSTDYRGVTLPVDMGGLGFDYKWDMGFMHDTLEYFQTQPDLRPQHYHKLTFSMMYFGNEKYLLPFSHDEVVHGKATILQKMNGQYENKFPQARAMYLYVAVHPGKKLNFMGNEFGQLREWDEKREQDWDLRKYPSHDGFFRFMSDLNKIYLSHSALFERDYYNGGFSWLDCHRESQCVYAVKRESKSETLIAVFNFSDKKQEYILPLSNTRAKILINTDWNIYGGTAEPEAKHLRFAENGIALDLAPFSGLLIESDRKDEN
ncbi:MAG: 1,4-alpha-glucan branching protein GlgB [Oscillospiraceae bacterium]|nr:1,4-alpha-glucan branching protein GlgB [Oscillospiraceae bacterium]